MTLVLSSLPIHIEAPDIGLSDKALITGKYTYILNHFNCDSKAMKALSMAPLLHGPLFRNVAAISFYEMLFFFTHLTSGFQQFALELRNVCFHVFHHMFMELDLFCIFAQCLRDSCPNCTDNA